MWDHRKVLSRGCHGWIYTLGSSQDLQGNIREGDQEGVEDEGPACLALIRKRGISSSLVGRAGGPLQTGSDPSSAV